MYIHVILNSAFQVPRMGQISDSCTSRWGRRRPFISLLSLLLVFSLMLLYLGESLSSEARWLRMVSISYQLNQENLKLHS